MINKRIFIITFLSFLSIYKSSSAQEWQLIGLEGLEIYCLELDRTNPNTIYAGNLSGNPGGLFRSIDGGTTWDTLLSPRAAVRDIDIHPYDSNIIYVTQAREILKSINKGKSWFRADAGIYLGLTANFSVLEIDPSNPEKLFVGLGGLFGGGFYMSENSGQSWQIVRVNSMNMVKTIAMDWEIPFYKYFGDFSSGRIFKSTDGGYNWHLTTYRNYEWGVYRIMVNPYKTGVIYVGSVLAGFFISEDFGYTWKSANEGLPSGSWVSGIALSKDKIYISATTDYEDAIYESYQDKISWEMIGDKKFNEWIRVIGYSWQNQTLYAGGKGIYKYTYPTDIKDSKQSFPVNQLFINNYPNPFNPGTIINYSLPESGYIQLKVYDILGREITTIVDEFQTVGDYKVKFDGSNLPGGIYLYSLKFGNSYFSKKMVLLK
jgi:photosystem II stability/assembly factor-like uncharacterized protein